MTPKKDSRKARVLWRLAQISDIAHFTVVIPFMFFGQFLVGQTIQMLFIAFVIGLQLAFLHCPMVVFSSWLRSFSYEDGWDKSALDRGLVWWLYHKFGVVAIFPIIAGIGVFVFACSKI